MENFALNLIGKRVIWLNDEEGPVIEINRLKIMLLPRTSQGDLF
jgi:hypothetical protein